jgi:hydrogenase-4 component F
VLHRQRFTGLLLLAALVATLGLPPFGLFYSELGILFAAARSGRWVTLAGFTLFLCIVFVGMVTAVLPMVFGRHAETAGSSPARSDGERWRYAAMASAATVLIAIGLALASYQPARVSEALLDAAAVFAPNEPGDALALTAPAEPR